MSALRHPRQSVNVSTELDATALQRLRELDPGGQNQLLERVLRAFDSSARRLAVQLAESRLRDDLLGIRHVAHTLKSSSASIGALALSRLCAEIELSIRNEALAGLGERLDAVDRELNAVLQAVKSVLGPVDAAGSSP
ncbi:MAG TPA: Hpt domain-containing protein [Caldimonas sp.]|nr:Hpt domain-containing protein [Caldimonas sp.]